LIISFFLRYLFPDICYIFYRNLRLPENCFQYIILTLNECVSDRIGQNKEKTGISSYPALKVNDRSDKKEPEKSRMRPGPGRCPDPPAPFEKRKPVLCEGLSPSFLY